VSATTASEPRRGEGWLIFAGVMLFVGGALGLIDGVAAITDSKFYVRHPNFIFGTLHTWGWIHLVVGALLIAAVFGIWAGAKWARWFGIAVATLGAISRLLFIPAYPLWSIALFGIDLLIVYGLAAYGGQPQARASEPRR
jgi:hypothetical protein